MTRRRRTQVILWLVSPRARRVVRPLLVVAAVGAVVLGTAGWIEINRQAEEPLEALSVIWALLAMFVIGGDTENVPTTLAIARLVAPIALAAAFLDLVVTLSQTRVLRWVVRRSTDHAVLFGVAERLRAYVPGAAKDGIDKIFHVVGPDQASVDGATGVDLSAGEDSWLVKSNVRKASLVVIATGSDEMNLSALSAAKDLLLAGGAEGLNSVSQTPQLVVEVDNQEFALNLAIRLAVHPDLTDLPIEVVCPPATLASQAARYLADEAADGGTILLVGDGPQVEGIARALLVEFSTRRLTRAPFVMSVRPGATEDELKAMRTANTSSRFNFSATADLSQVDTVEVKESTVVVVDFADPDETLRRAIELACQFSCPVYPMLTQPCGLFPGLVSLRGAIAKAEDYPVGPFAEAAAVDQGGGDVGRDMRLRRTQGMRAMARVLVGDGYTLAPLDVVGDRYATTLLPNDVQARMADVSGGVNPERVPLRLRGVGIGIKQPARDQQVEPTS